jgi:uncharacterized protein (TIGR02147 family)
MKEQIEIRKILNNEITRAKGNNPAYSLRAFAKKVGVQPSALSEILNGKRDVTQKMAAKILERLCFDPETTQNLLSKLSNKKSRNKTVDSQRDFAQLNMDHYHIISEWYYFGILSLAETKEFNDKPQWIASRLNITIPEAKVALKRLERLDLLKRNENKRLVWAGVQFKTSDDVINMSLRKSHYQNLELAKTSLDKDNIDSRDFSSMTMAIDPKKIPDAKEMIKNFRRTLCDFLESGEKLEVYRICLQLFPISRKRDL